MFTWSGMSLPALWDKIWSRSISQIFCQIPDQEGKVKWKSLSRVHLFATPWTVGHGILQTRILEWVTFLFSRGSSQPRDRTQVSCIVGGYFPSWATREAGEYWSGQPILSPADLPPPRNQTGALQVDSLPTELSGKPRGEDFWTMETFLPSAVAALQSKLVNPEEEYLLSGSHKPPYGECWESSEYETQDYRPQVAEVHIKKIILMNPDSCNFPYVEKHSIPWDAASWVQSSIFLSLQVWTLHKGNKGGQMSTLGTLAPTADTPRKIHLV